MRGESARGYGILRIVAGMVEWKNQLLNNDGFKAASPRSTCL